MNGMLETIQKRAPLARRPEVLLGLLVIIGAVLRVVVNDVGFYSPADEAHYVDVTRWFGREGLSAYPKFVATYLEEQAMWQSPTPLRWGYFSLTTLMCSVHTPCDGRAIAWLSTIAGVLSLLFTYALGHKLVGRTAALLATAVSVVSCLQLGLGRRALPDEVYCAAFLAAFWTFTRVLDSNNQDSRAAVARRWAWFVATSALAFSIKEAFVFPYTCFAMLYLFVRTVRNIKPSEVAVFLAPPLLFCLGFVLLGHRPSALVDIMALHEASFSGDYGVRQASGPAHRPLLDFFLLAPIVVALAAAALMKMIVHLREGKKERWLGGFLILALVAVAGLPKTARFLVMLDPIVRLLAAWFLVNHGLFDKMSARGKGAIAALFVLLNGIVEYLFFDAAFRQRNMIDPTAFDLFAALGAIPDF